MAGSSYEDGGSSYRGGRGSYSRTDAKEYMVNKLGEMMSDAESEQKEALKKCMRDRTSIRDNEGDEFLKRMSRLRKLQTNTKSR